MGVESAKERIENKANGHFKGFVPAGAQREFTKVQLNRIMKYFTNVVEKLVASVHSVM